MIGREVFRDWPRMPRGVEGQLQEQSAPFLDREYEELQNPRVLKPTTGLTVPRAILGTLRPANVLKFEAGLFWKDSIF